MGFTLYDNGVLHKFAPFSDGRLKPLPSGSEHIMKKTTNFQINCYYYYYNAPLCGIFGNTTVKEIYSGNYHPDSHSLAANICTTLTKIVS